MKKFFKFAAVAAIAAMFVSCTEKPGPDPDNSKDPETPDTPKVELTENLAFTLEVTEVETDKAKVKVEHNGTTNDTWYAFATTDTDVNAAITAKVAEITADGGKIAGIKKGKSTTVTVRSLEQDTDYTFIAFGITAEGQVYGTAASTTFKTEKEEVVPPAPEGYTINPNWTVTYIGDYEQDGEIYDNVVVVETTDTNPFFVTAWPVDYFEELGIEAIVDEEIKAWEEMLAQYPGATWNDIVYTESILAQVTINPEYGTKWYAMAIGCDTKGKATGLYALSEVIDLENLGGGGDNGGEENLTEAYAAWLGDWTITGANGIQQFVTFSKGKANETFLMSGYEGDDAAGLNVTVNWMEEEGIWVIYNQMLGTFNFGSYGNGDVWFLGEGETEDIYLSEVPICIGGTLEDGSLEAYGYEEEYELEDGTPMSYKVVTMEYLAYLTDHGQLSYITSTFETGYPTFPMTFTKTETKSASTDFVVRKHSFGKVEKKFSVKGIR